MFCKFSEKFLTGCFCADPVKACGCPRRAEKLIKVKYSREGVFWGDGLCMDSNIMS